MAAENGKSVGLSQDEGFVLTNELRTAILEGAGIPNGETQVLKRGFPRKGGQPEIVVFVQPSK